jgi:hypothetical protein
MYTAADADQDNERAEEEYVQQEPPVEEKTMMQFLKDKNLNLHDRNLVQRLSTVCICMCMCVYVCTCMVTRKP